MKDKKMSKLGGGSYYKPGNKNLSKRGFKKVLEKFREIDSGGGNLPIVGLDKLPAMPPGWKRTGLFSFKKDDSAHKVKR